MFFAKAKITQCWTPGGKRTLLFSTAFCYFISETYISITPIRAELKLATAGFNAFRAKRQLSSSRDGRETDRYTYHQIDHADLHAKLSETSRAAVSVNLYSRIYPGFAVQIPLPVFPDGYNIYFLETQASGFGTDNSKLRTSTSAFGSILYYMRRGSSTSAHDFQLWCTAAQKVTCSKLRRIIMPRQETGLSGQLIA